MPKHWLDDGEEVTVVAGGVPTQEMAEEAVTGVVIDLDMEEKLREILRQDLFMRAADVDAIFELARRWDLGSPKPKMSWPTRA